MDKIELEKVEASKEKAKEKKEKKVREESGNGKKFIIGIVFMVTLVIAGYTLKENYFNDQKQPPPFFAVQGVATERKTPQINYSTDALQNVVEKNVDMIKTEVNSLDTAEIATSSPQIQKIINDLKSLQQYPRNQVKTMCMNVCNSL